MTGIHTLLIANRGEIARRIIRTAREMGIRTVAVYADADRTAPHVREADVAVPLRGDTVADTYLDVTQLLDAAAWQGADAVHPGYGFLAERAPFARAVVDAGLQWVGPPPEAITTLGDKLRARALAATIDIPVLPGAVLGTDHVDAWHSLADEIGFPLMVKAAAGGGGRGMRVVDDAGALADAVAAAGREALAAFGDATVYLERLVRAPRHVEVQIVADRHGTVLHLGERECSIQRRHQKLIEEAPSPSLDDATRADIAAAAVRLAAEVGYESLGTVEVLVDDRSAEPTWWFLEMNTRIQVEHPVTEAVYGVDLVRLQLEVAGGQALRLRQEDLVPHGHAIEARVCAEDPLADWAPSAGPVHRFAPGPTPGLRYDAAVASGAVVAPDYDSLLVKVIAHADDRVEATRRLVRGLRELVLHGPATNRTWLVDALSSEAFAEAETHTDFVDRHPAVPDDDAFALERRLQRLNTVVGPHLAAAALVGQVERHAASPWAFAPSNWRNVGGAERSSELAGHAWRLLEAPPGAAAQSVTFLVGAEPWQLTYTRAADDHPLERKRRAAGSGEPTSLFEVAISGPDGTYATLVELERLDAGPLTPGPSTWMVHAGRRGQQVEVCRYDDTWFVNSALGETCARELARFEPLDGDDGSGGVVAPLPGRVVAVLVAAGDTVAAGDELVVLEAMKVEHRLSAPGAGVVSAVLVAVGDTVDAHAPLVHLATEATETEPTDAGPSDTGPATTTPPQERRDES